MAVETIGAPVARRAPRVIASRVLWGYVFAGPAILGIIVFSLGPILFAFWVSVHQWNLISPIPDMVFVGLRNYADVVTSDVFRAAFRNTVEFTVVGVGINTVLGLLLALLLNQRLRVRAFWRTLFFLPLVTPPLALGIMWTSLLDRNYGAINAVLSRLHLPPQPFLASPDQALASIIAIAVYQYVGMYVIIYLAGLQGIPQDYYDAAAVDGAGRWRSFRHITLPLLRPVFLFIVVTNTIGALQVFDVVFAATTGGAQTSGGGPANSTMVVVLDMYNTAFKFFEMGPATAMAVILFAITLLVTLAQLRLLRPRI